MYYNFVGLEARIKRNVHDRAVL